MKKTLLEYQYNKHGVTAAHQVMATGHKAILETLFVELEADRDVQLQDGNKLVHCAA